MKYLKPFLLLLLCCNSACEQNNAQSNHQSDNAARQKASILTSLPKAKFIEDLDQLIFELKNNHPQLYKYISEDELEQLVEKKKSLITDNFKIGEFTWLCRSIVSKIACGHTVVPTLGMDYFLPDSLLFPLKVNYINNKLYVIGALENNEQVAAGDEILKINGSSVQNIFDEMSKHISSDAGNLSLKTEFINDGFMEYAAFHFGFTNSYVIEIQKAGEIKSVVLNQLTTYTEEVDNQEKCKTNLCFDIDKNNDLAIITIRSFFYYRENFESTFKPFIDSCFREIKTADIQNLIIDLRDNGGGDPYCGSYLLEHIADKPYQYYKTGTNSYKDLQQMIYPNKNRFEGKPFILINGRCFSTTGQLCALIKSNDFGIFVGKETGATYICNATVKPYALDNTGVTPFIATRTFEANASSLPDDRGIIPDHKTKTEISDLVNKNDVDLEFCLNLISNK